MLSAYKETDIGLIPEDWDYLNLGKLCNFVTGKLNSNMAEEGGIYPFFTCSPEILSINSYSYDREAILLAGNNAEGKFNVKYYNGKFDVYQRTYVITIKNIKKLNYFYLYFALILSLDRLRESSQGTATKFLTMKILNSMELPVPPIEEQNKIGRILTSLDNKINLNNQMNQTLEAIGQAIFRHWFVHFEFPDENGQPYKSSGGEMVDSELGEIPAGWEVNNIYKICDVVYGAPFSSKYFNEDEDGIPLVRIRDLKKFKSGFFTTETHPKGTFIYPGDIVAGMDAEFTPYFWLGEKSWMNQRICMFKPKYEYLHRFFIYNTVKIPLKFYENSKVGTTVIHLSKSDIDRFKVIIPPKNVLKIFYTIIEPIFERIIINAQEANKLVNIRDSLLPKLMSGKIRVPMEASND